MSGSEATVDTRAALPPAAGPTAAGVRAVIAYKVAKAALELTLALFLVASFLSGHPNELSELAEQVRQHVTARWSTELSQWLMRNGTQRNLELAAAALIFDGGVTLLEGWGLYRRYAWAPWLVVVVTGALLPWEVVEFISSPRVGRALLFLVNLVIVAYLVRHARRYPKMGS